MKKIKLLLCVLLVMAMAFSLVACSSVGNTDGTADKTVNDSAGDSAISDVSEESDDNVEVEREKEPSTGMTYSGANSGMGIENSFYFATPIRDGEAFNATAVDEICLAPNRNDIGTGAKINMGALNNDYIISGLDSFKVYLGSGAFDKEEGSYEKELEIHMDYMNAFDSYYADMKKYEEVDDITFYFDYGDLVAIKKHNDVYLCITWYSHEYEAADDTLQNLKAEMLNIFANATFVDNVEPEFASSRNFDSLSFSCGWNVADIVSVNWSYGEISFEYKEKDRGGNLTFNVTKLSEAEMAENIEAKDEEVYEPLTDAAGNVIGYIDTYKRDERNMRYYIRLDDGSYMNVTIHETFFEGDLDFHNWSEVEALLTSGK